MTATNHAVTGAVIALTLKRPELAIPLAFISHFVLDAIPHFGIHEDDVLKRNVHWLFRCVMTSDVILAVSAFIILPIIGRNVVAWGWIVASMTAAFTPDLVWIARYFEEMRTKISRPHGRYARFHQCIQWSETPWGLIVEIVWLAGGLACVALAL
ncbi:MAG: hypothetical protein ACQR33_05865 [Candidatus Saccharibacteria bacterium]